MVKKRLIPVLVCILCLCCSLAPAQGTVSIPAGVTVIPAGAFENTHLEDAEVQLPTGVTRIESRAFAGTGLKMISLSDKIEYIAPDAFDGCADLHPTVIPGSYAAKWCARNGITPYTLISLGTAARSQGEIRSFADAHPVDYSSNETFRRAPKGGPYGGSTYSPGLLSDSSLSNGINMVNQIRFIAGLNADVVNDPDHEEALGAAAMVNSLNSVLSHYPERPSVLAASQYDELYSLACSGASSGNLCAGYSNLARTVLTYMDDSDVSNIDRVGHRRWILNPSMGMTTFGLYGLYSGMYALDRSGSGNQKPVAWPARQTPLSRFGWGSQNIAWSVSFGKSLDESSIHVTVTRLSDRQVWSFSAESADGAFYVNNQGFGQAGCVIFRPFNLDTIRAGDRFRVQIRNDADLTVLEYTVEFFEL